jgi:hypothetical protein
LPFASNCRHSSSAIAASWVTGAYKTAGLPRSFAEAQLSRSRCCCCLQSSRNSQSENAQRNLVHFSNVKVGVSSAPEESLVRKRSQRMRSQGPEIKASHFSVTGRGTVLANAPLLQTRAYWDLKIVQKGDARCVAAVAQTARVQRCV